MTSIDAHGGPERYALVTDDGVRIPFDTIESTGWGHWRLEVDGEQRGLVTDLSEWPDDVVRTFRKIQFGRSVDLGVEA